MPINVPQAVFDKFYEGIDYTFDLFGVACKLVSIDKPQVITYVANNNIPEKNSINAHRNRGGDYDRSNITVHEVEVLTDIKLKVYWDPKHWISVTNSIKLSDGIIQTVGFISDLPAVLAAKALIVNSPNHQGLRFERVGEHSPQGFNSYRYFVCFWKRV